MSSRLDRLERPLSVQQCTRCPKQQYESGQQIRQIGEVAEKIDDAEAEADVNA